MASNLQRVRLTCSNCGVLGVNIDPCEYCRLLPQCRKCRRRMPGRCFAKSTTPTNLRGETRSICINRLIVSPIMHEQTNSIICTTNFCLCCVELRYEEVALPKAESEGGFGGRARRTRIRYSFGRYRLSNVPPSQL